MAGTLSLLPLPLGLSWVLIFGWVKLVDISLVPHITLKEHVFSGVYVNQGASEGNCIHISLAWILLL